MTTSGRPRRGSSVAGFVVAALALVVAGEAAHLWTRDDAARIAAAREVVRIADLTDLALFTEARYARHRALADLHAAFQDGPMSFEHFPAGSLVAPARDFPGGWLADVAPPPVERTPMEDAP